MNHERCRFGDRHGVFCVIAGAAGLGFASKVAVRIADVGCNELTWALASNSRDGIDGLDPLPVT